MASKDKATLIADLSNSATDTDRGFADNSTGDISPEILRERLTEIIENSKNEVDEPNCYIENDVLVVENFTPNSKIGVSLFFNPEEVFFDYERNGSTADNNRSIRFYFNNINTTRVVYLDPQNGRIQQLDAFGQNLLDINGGVDNYTNEGVLTLLADPYRSTLSEVFTSDSSGGLNINISADDSEFSGTTFKFRVWGGVSVKVFDFQTGRSFDVPFGYSYDNF